MLARIVRRPLWRSFLAMMILVSGKQLGVTAEAEEPQVATVEPITRVVLLDAVPTEGPGGVLYYQIGIEFQKGLGFLAMETAMGGPVILINEKGWLPVRPSSRGLTPLEEEAFDPKRRMLKGWAPLPKGGDIEVLAGVVRAGQQGGSKTRKALLNAGAKPYVVRVEDIPLLPEAAIRFKTAESGMPPPSLTLLAKLSDGRWDVRLFAPMLKDRTEQDKSPLRLRIGDQVLESREGTGLPISICGTLQASPKVGDPIYLVGDDKSKPVTLSAGITQDEMRRARLAGVVVEHENGLKEGRALFEVDKQTKVTFGEASVLRESVLGYCFKELGYPRVFGPRQGLRLTVSQYASLESAVALIGLHRAGEYSGILIRYLAEEPGEVGSDRLPRLRALCRDALIEIGKPAREVCIERLSEATAEAERGALVSVLAELESAHVAGMFLELRIKKETDPGKAAKLRVALELLRAGELKRSSEAPQPTVPSSEVEKKGRDDATDGEKKRRG